MKKTSTILSICVSILFLFGCKTPDATVAGSYSYKTECVENKLDGTMILKTWGNGFSKREAIRQAKKNAIESVLFKGILDGKPNCDTKPLVTEVNAYEKNKAYFNDFFSERGDYLDFVDQETTYKTPVMKSSEKRTTVSIIVRVMQSELREKLVKDQIIK